jgi:phasin family protein
MNAFTNEHFAAVQQKQLAAISAWGNATIEAVRRLTELNLQTARAVMAEQRERVTALATGQDWREVYAAQGNGAQPATDKAMSYARHVQEIAADAQSEYQKLWEAAFIVPAQAPASTIITTVSQ